MESDKATQALARTGATTTQVLRELNTGGRVSKKTQLAVDDAARLAEEMPLPT